jgi:thioredoxin-like negative regulator of GroEL
VERIAEKFKGKAEFFRVNAMNDRSLAMRFGVMGTPSFLMLCKGTPIASQVGGVYPALLERMVQEAIDHGSECAERQTRFSYEITGYG